MELTRYEGIGNQGLIKSEIDKITGLIASGDFDNDTVLGNIESNKHLPGFLSSLQQAIVSIGQTQNGLVKNLTETFREDQAYNNLSKITDSSVTVTKALEIVKNEIASYYQMIFNNIQGAKTNSNKKVINSTTALTMYHPNHEGGYTSGVDMHFVENFFVWKDPLFWTALFLYQKELNYAHEQSSGIAQIALMTYKCYTFTLSELSQREEVKLMKEGKIKTNKQSNLVENFKKRKDEFLLLNFDKSEFKKLGIYKQIQGLSYGDINEGFVTGLKEESQKQSKLADKVREEYSTSEKIFHEIRLQAQSAINDKEIVRAVRESVALIGSKFYTKQLSPLDTDIKYVRSYENLASFIKEYIVEGKNTSDYSKNLTTFCQKNGIKFGQDSETGEQNPQNDLLKVQELIFEIKREKETLSQYITSPTINNESEFMATMTHFAHNNSLYQVRGISLATAALGLNSAGTLKGLVDRLTGRIAKTEKPTKKKKTVADNETTASSGQYLLDLPETYIFDEEGMENAKSDIGENDLGGISLSDLDMLTEDYDD